MNIRFVRHSDPMVNLWETIQSDGSSYLLSQLLSHAISFEGHRHVHSVGCNVSVRFFQRTEKHLAHQRKTIRCCILLGMATSQLKSQAEAHKGRVLKEGACRHGGLGK